MYERTRYWTMKYKLEKGENCIKLDEGNVNDND